MWRAVVVKVPPAAPAVSLDVVKTHLGVDHPDHDALITTYISVAAAHVESITGQRLSPQTLMMKADEWSDLSRLPLAPIQSVSEIAYIGAAGQPSVLSEADYVALLDGLEPMIRVDAPPLVQSGALIEVEVEAGYPSPPPELKAAVLLIVGDLYAFRESAQSGSVSGEIKVSATVSALLANHRIHLI